MNQRPPLSPEAAAVLQLHEQLQRASGRRGFSRRALLGGAGALGAGAFLSACGTGGTGTTNAESKPTPAADTSDQDKVVHWANWTAYLDYDDEKKVYPTLEAFQEQTGIKATYSEEIEDNDSYYGKIQGQLKNSQDIGQDVVVFTDYMAARMVRQGYAQELDMGNIPNAANLIENLKNVDFDPGRKHSLTWQSGYAGIAYNVKWFADNGIPAPTKVEDLWNPKLKGRVEVLSEFRDTVGLIMLEQDVDISQSFTDEQFQAGLDVLKTQLDNGQIRQVRGNSYLEDLVPIDNPAAVAVIAWSGDIFVANADNGKEGQPDPFAFLLPEKGGTLWSDNLMIPIGSPHKKNAEILFNYYYDPKVAAQVAAWVNYICPVNGAKEEMKNFDESLTDSKFIFPTASDLENVKVFRTLTPEEETKYTEAFQKVLGA